jgi:hypothetical protein
MGGRVNVDQQRCLSAIAAEIPAGRATGRRTPRGWEIPMKIDEQSLPAVRVQLDKYSAKSRRRTAWSVCVPKALGEA